jgi:heme-degrading monooxygenase HmoA
MSGQNKMYAYMWEYKVKTEYKMTFEEMYSPGGRWNELFKKAKGFIRTELFHDQLDSIKYITIDYWNSKSDQNEFMLSFSDEYKALDTECAAFALNERYIGEFDVIC